ncbi:MAG: response regulator [Bacteroidota bacterium]
MKYGNVLIVEDEPIMAYGLKVRFEKWGFDKVDVVENCDKMMARLDNYTFTLAVLDTSNDDHSLEMAQMLQAKAPLAVLFLSTMTVRMNAKKLKAIKHYKRINKPCQITQLRQVVEFLLSVRLPEDDLN